MKAGQEEPNSTDKASAPAASTVGSEGTARRSKKPKTDASQSIGSTKESTGVTTPKASQALKRKASPSIGGGSRMRLPEKLLKFLNDEPMPEVVWWMPDGNGFAYNAQTVQTHFLDKHFRGTKVTSFVRSLNRWGFRRVFYHALPEHVIAFYHPKFKRNRPDLVRKINMASLPKDQSSEDGDTLEAPPEECDASPGQGVAPIEPAPATMSDSQLKHFSPQVQQGSAAAPLVQVASSSFAQPGQPQTTLPPDQQQGSVVQLQALQQLIGSVLPYLPNQSQQPLQLQDPRQVQNAALANFQLMLTAALAQQQQQQHQAPSPQAIQEGYQQAFQSQPQFAAANPIAQMAQPQLQPQQQVQQPQQTQQPQALDQLQQFLMHMAQAQPQQHLQQLPPQNLLQPQQSLDGSNALLQSALQFAQQGLAQAILQQQHQPVQQQQQQQQQQQRQQNARDQGQDS